jgi:predicted acylesterase/phospholipase RssA
VVGTSIGAHIGAMYAAGYTGAEIEALVLSLPLGKAFPGYRPQLPDPLQDLPVFFTLRGRPGEGLNLYFSLAEQQVIEQSLRQSLSSGKTAKGHDFSSLLIPMFVVTTDMETGEAVTLSSGDLVQAVLASSALPILLPPVVVDGRPLVDGGLSQNIPVKAARELGAVRVLVSDASNPIEEGTLDPDCQTDRALAVLSGLFNQGPLDLREGDVVVQADLQGQSKLEFSRENRSRLIQLGYEAAMAQLIHSSCIPEAPDSWRTHEPTGGNGYGTAGANGNGEKMEDLMAATPGVGPKLWRFVGVGGEYRHGFGASAWMGWVEPRVLGGRAVGSAVVVAGSRAQRIELSLRGSADQRFPLRPFITAAAEHRDVPEFGPAGGELRTLDAQHFFVTAGPEIRFGESWTARGGLKLMGWQDRDGRTFESDLGGTVMVEGGNSRGVSVQVEALWAGSFSSLSTQGQWPIPMGSTRLTPYFRFGRGWNPPLHLRAPFGGGDGFPGLHVDEGRGDGEVLGGLRVDQSVAGPLRLRLDLAAGMVKNPGLSLPDEEWILGLRGGIGLDTPLGPIDVGYGVTNTGRGALHVVAGRRR